MTRKGAQDPLDIRNGLDRVKAHAGETLTAIHIYPADFKKIRKDPGFYDCYRKDDTADSKILTTYRGRMIEVKEAP